MSVRPFTLRQILRVAFAMGWADFLLKYRGSFLGYLWSLAAPLLKFLVILYVFSPYVSPSIPNYPLYLFLGLIVWEHFTLTTGSCMSMLQDKAPLIQKITFPRLVLVLACGWTTTLIFATHLFIFSVFALLLGVHFTWAALLFPVVFLHMTLFALGTGMFLASYSLRFQDIRHLWDVLLQVLFWLTPITYPHLIRGAVGHEAWLILQERVFSGWAFLQAFTTSQPLSVLLFDARRILLYAVDGVPSVFHLLLFTAIFASFFTMGALLFSRRSKHFIQEY